MTARARQTFHRHAGRPAIASVLALAVALALAGCGGGAAEKSPAPTLTMTGAAPHGVEAPPPPAPTSTVAATPAPAPEPEKVYPEPSKLTGLDADAVAGLLGAPRFKRRDDPAEIWQYRSQACALDLFLYRAGKDGPYRVKHFETRGRDKKPVAAKDCFVGLLKAHEKARAG